MVQTDFTCTAGTPPLVQAYSLPALPERRLWLGVQFTSATDTKAGRYPALHRIRVFKGTKVVIQLVKVVIRQRSVGVMAERVGGTGAGAIAWLTCFPIGTGFAPPASLPFGPQPMNSPTHRGAWCVVVTKPRPGVPSGGAKVPLCGPGDPLPAPSPSSLHFHTSSPLRN